MNSTGSSECRKATVIEDILPVHRNIHFPARAEEGKMARHNPMHPHRQESAQFPGLEKSRIS